MAMTTRMRSVTSGVGSAADMATAAAPYVRRLVRDEDLRSSVGDLISSADDLYSRLSGRRGLDRLVTDDKVRRDIDHLVGSLQHSARRVRRDTRKGTNYSAIMVGAGLLVVIAGGVVAAVVLYPRRRDMARVIDETRERATATVHDARELAAATAHDARERAAATAHDARERAAATAHDARERFARSAEERRAA
jgi:hypothetical protein